MVPPSGELPDATERKFAVLTLLGAGLTAQAIARRLHTSPGRCTSTSRTCTGSSGSATGS
jgi:hypothetical protein